MEENKTNVLLHNHGQNIEQLLEKMPSENQFMLVADVFSQLCDSTRLRILWILCHSEECVSDIAEIIHMSAPAVSHHLRNLKQMGLIVARREGKEVLYKLAKDKKAELVHNMIDDMFEMDCKENKT